VPESPAVSAYVPAKFVSFGGPVAGLVVVPVIVTVPAPAVVGMEITIVTFVPLTVPFGVIETPEASWPWHFDGSFDGQASVFPVPVNVAPIWVKLV